MSAAVSSARRLAALERVSVQLRYVRQAIEMDLDDHTSPSLADRLHRQCDLVGDAIDAIQWALDVEVSQ